MTLIALLEIMEKREFRITNGSVSPFDLASPIMSSVPKPLRCASSTASLRESLG
jgi:hypothetical protein